MSINDATEPYHVMTEYVMTEEQVVLDMLFDRQWQRREIAGDDTRAEAVRAYLQQQIDALDRTMKLIKDYRAIKAALAVLLRSDKEPPE